MERGEELGLRYLVNFLGGTMFQKTIFAILAASFAFSASAFAIPLRTPDQVFAKPNRVESLLLREQTDYDFEGIAKLSNCSGSLIKFENSSSTDKGLILTNGHCLGGLSFLQPGEVVVNRESSRTFQIFKTLDDTMRVQADMILYATMTDTDITIYRLTNTYEEIESESGIRPLTLSSVHPEVGANMEVISGYWERGYSCQIEAFIKDLHEEDYIWKDSIRYSRPGCEIIGGTSGSPVVLAGERTVIGINNTGNESGEKCTMNNPCEIDENGDIVFVKGYGYGQQTYLIYTCLNDKNEIDLEKEGCELPKGE